MKHDAHLHIKEDALVQELMQYEVQGIVNVADAVEYERIKRMQRQWKGLYVSAGIHPWKIDEHSWEELFPIMKDSSIIGEIGLDCVWCDTLLSKQIEIFERSLKYASKARKPVILHIKGMEREALAYLGSYPNTYLVHWYSCDEHLQEYIDLDCYFTIGPSVGKDRAVTNAAKQIPLNRMLIETDGVDALSWCEGKQVDPKQYHSYLDRSIQRIAELRQLPEEDVEGITNENFLTFLRCAGIQN